MHIHRRRFIELAGLGAAAWAVGGGRPVAGQAVTLELTLWGSFLYAFPKDRRRVELGCLTATASVGGCDPMPHLPALRITSGRLDPASTIQPGKMPEGEYTLALPKDAPALVAEGLGAEVQECPVDGVPRSLAHLPRLAAAKGEGLGTWHSRFRTRFNIRSGTLRGAAPLYAPGTPRWRVSGPGGGVRGPFAFTDTTVLSVPLPSGAARFDRTEGGQGFFAILPDQDSSTIRAELTAGPVDESLPYPAPGDRDLHFCRLYAAFDPAPALAERAELLFSDWCGQEPRLPQQDFRMMAASRGFDPVKICTGGWLEVP